MNQATPTDQAARDRIRTDLGSTLFVQAGAGTGKTRQLIERIVRLVSSGTAKLRHIAATPFPESAAAALRHRLRPRLAQSAQQPHPPHCGILWIHGFSFDYRRERAESPNKPFVHLVYTEITEYETT